MNDKTLTNLVVTEAAKLIASKIEIDKDRLTILTAEILANRILGNVGLNATENSLARAAREKALEITAQALLDEVIHA